MFSASKSAAPATTGGYQVSNSLRFRYSASAYLSRTYTSSATWTLSLWVKRGMLSAVKPILGSAIKFNANDTLTAGTLTTTAVYRDPSAWYHIVVSNNGCYINGTSIGSVTTSALTNASIGSDGTNYFDGYMADINFIDGQALTPSSFGEYNVITGVWTPKSYAGTYGTNGFHLNFSNGTSTTTLGYDSSGNGNNWTTNNISLTAGATYDWMIDSPTSFAGSSYGVGNYAVLNPLAAKATGYLTDGNLVSASNGGNYYNTTPSSIAVSSGKWYFEALLGGGGTNSNTVGIVLSSILMSAAGAGSIVNLSGTYGYINPGWSTANGSINTSYGASFTFGDVIGVALDLNAGTITFYKNGVSQGVAATGITGSFAMFVEPYMSSNWTTNFGQRPFAYTPPTGYKALCTYNLPTPTIQNGSNFMAATLYTGTGASQSITNTVNSVSFQPDFVWIKRRDAAQDHNVYDSVRGSSGGYVNQLITNATNAENYYGSGNYGAITTLNSNGFSVNSANSNFVLTNASGGTYVAWQWKAGGTAVTNTAGSITSSVSANTTSGFSVVTYTGTGANATVGHGLGVAPSMMIFKNRDNGATNWSTYHVALGATNVLLLNGTGAVVSNGWLQNTTPSSTVVSIGAIADGYTVNISTQKHVAYCFAAIPGYSAFGSYTGNGSADGPFVYCGFRPRWVLIKNSSGATNYWVIYDTARDVYNVAGKELYPNTSDAEFSTTSLDITSNGFKIRSTSGGLNANANVYIYAAFAENPFNYSLAR